DHPAVGVVGVGRRDFSIGVACVHHVRGNDIGGSTQDVAGLSSQESVEAVVEALRSSIRRVGHPEQVASTVIGHRGDVVEPLEGGIVESRRASGLSGGHPSYGPGLEESVQVVVLEVGSEQLLAQFLAAGGPLAIRSKLRLQGTANVAVRIVDGLDGVSLIV